MPNIITQLVLFFSSYAPLFVILAIRTPAGQQKTAAALWLTALFSAIGLFVFLRTARGLAANAITIKSASPKDSDAMSYLVTYLVPFLDVHFSDISNAISLAILFITVGIIYVNSNMIHINPLLNFCCYHIFEVRDSDGKTWALISKQSYIRDGTALDAVILGNYVLFEKTT